MIIVVEGISASGKTTWCEAFGQGHIVPENGPADRCLPANADERIAAGFWTDRNVARWSAALAAEQETGLAVCDTDPLKLHYSWSLWRIGEGSEQAWRLEAETMRAAMAGRRIGFADAYVVGRIDAEIARRRRDGDATRTRRNFDLHVRLQEPLLAWYRAMSTVLPDRVELRFPDRLPAPAPLAPGERYDVARFDLFIQTLLRDADPPQ
jgi:hypothetical protein